jgi:hypothetical protein
MSDAVDREGGTEATDASVGHAGEPHGKRDTRDLAREEGVGPTPEDLDAREEAFTGPRKAMGPGEDQDEVPPTTPEEG